MSKNERKLALSVIALMVAFGTASWAQQTHLPRPRGNHRHSQRSLLRLRDPGPLGSFSHTPTRMAMAR